ncbi:MAG TPA: hypothetical protein VHX88_22100 [Solirubrobacteraceae bacterium]|nr:hypothetical protein [Solirubrobacteraceae bacterium]
MSIDDEGGAAPRSPVSIGPLGRALRAAASRAAQRLRAPGAVAGHALPAHFDTSYQPRAARRPNLVQVSVAVISRGGENGHVELLVGPGATPSVLVGVVALRHEEGAGRVGAGGQLSAIVPAGQGYRIATRTIEGYATPEFVMVSWVTETPL